ncbi:MAG: hypothetical protein AAGJ35_14750, partial [Myxococcota bacterium]
AVAVSPDGKRLYVMGACSNGTKFGSLVINNAGSKEMCVAMASMNKARLTFERTYSAKGDVRGQVMVLKPGRGLLIAGTYFGTAGVGQAKDNPFSPEVIFREPDVDNKDREGELKTGDGIFVALLGEGTLNYLWQEGNAKKAVTAFVIGDEMVTGIHVNDNGVIFLAVQSFGLARFGTFKFQELDAEPNSWNSFVVRLGPDGTFVNTPRYLLISNKDVFLTTTTFDAQGSLYMGGFFLGDTQVNPPSKKGSFQFRGEKASFVWKFPKDNL